MSKWRLERGPKCPGDLPSVRFYERRRWVPAFFWAWIERGHRWPSMGWWLETFGVAKPDSPEFWAAVRLSGNGR